MSTTNELSEKAKKELKSKVFNDICDYYGLDTSVHNEEVFERYKEFISFLNEKYNLRIDSINQITDKKLYKEIKQNTKKLLRELDFEKFLSRL